MRLLAWLSSLVVCVAHAHDPFDNSSTLFAFDDHLELGITMGISAAQDFLESAGQSEVEVAETLKVRGVGTRHPLPVD